MAFDVIVLGLGAMGSAAAYHLAARGVRVLGIEQFTSPHDHGSSHGESRIIRQAYFEGTEYVPLVLRAYELWRKLEAHANKRLLHITGGLTLGSPDGDLVRQTLASAREHGIPFEVFEGADITKRFAAVRPVSGDVAVLEPHAGYLLPEACIQAHLKSAQQSGADLHFQETVTGWHVSAQGVEVETSRGRYEAGHILITAGPWASDALKGLFPLKVTRQVMAWIQPQGGVADFTPYRFPVWLAEDPDGGALSYGFPAIDGNEGGVKAAVHGSEEVCTPQTVDRTIHAADLRRLLDKVRLRMPMLDGEVLRAKTCMYTLTPDENFVIGPHPHADHCTVACGFSGHGFKFSSAVGEMLADLATEGKTMLPIRIFDPRRFLTSTLQHD